MRDATIEVEVWEGEHERAFDVFRHCQPEIVAGMSAVLFVGVRAQEVESAARAVGVEFGAGLLDDVRCIASAAHQELNKAKRT